MRPQRPCNQPHGTASRYAAGCSCFECCEAKREYLARQRAGETRLVDGDEARAVIAKLRRRGFSRRAISEGTGLSYRTLRAIESGESHSVRQDTIAELRAFCSPPKGSTALVSAARTHDLVARLERTMTRGQMAARLGIPRASIPASTQRRVQYRTQERIEALARAEGLLKERVDTERLRILLDEGCGVELAAEIIGTDPRSAYRVLAMAAS